MEETPGDWKMGRIVKLPKKGDLSLCKNWRGITLLSITSKVFSRVDLDRISEALDPLLRKEQAGFRKGKSCGDHIFTLRQTLEQCQEWNTPFYANFIDFEKAFDSIHSTMEYPQDCEHNEIAIWRFQDQGHLWPIPDRRF